MIKFGSLRGSLGHLILNTLRYFIEKKKTNNCFLFISTPKSKISNIFLYKILCNNFSTKRIFFSHNIIIYFIYALLFKLKNKIQIFSIFICNIEWIHHEKPKKEYGSNYNFDEKFYSKVPKIFIPTEYEAIFKNWCNNKKFKKKKIVCFSSRDKYYHKENYEDPRNSKFSDYKLIIKKLIKAGYVVVRMGYHKKNDFNFKDKNYFDFYEEEKHNKYLKLIEILLFKNCEFIVSGPSGIDSYAALFKKKIFIINHFPAGRIPRYRNCVFIPQKYIKRGLQMNFNKIEKKILLCEDTKILKSYKLSVKKNSSRDIYDLIIKNYKNKKLLGKSLKNYNFVIEGKNSSSLLCNSWYKKNKNLLN